MHSLATVAKSAGQQSTGQELKAAWKLRLSSYCTASTVQPGQCGDKGKEWGLKGEHSIWSLHRTFGVGVIFTLKAETIRLSHKEMGENTIRKCQDITKDPESTAVHNINMCEQMHPSPKQKQTDLSWCRCRSWPCCQPTTPSHTVTRSRATAPSVAASTWPHCCRAAGAYRSPGRPPGPAVGCASSSVVPLNKHGHNHLPDTSFIRKWWCRFMTWHWVV